MGSTVPLELRIVVSTASHVDAAGGTPPVVNPEHGIPFCPVAADGDDYINQSHMMRQQAKGPFVRSQRVDAARMSSNQAL